jgi:DNA polymerase-1
MVHTSFNQCGTVSGRLSSRDPNLQQIEKLSIIKRMFASRFGKDGCIYQFDLSQIELRLLAAVCGDPTMVQAYWDRVDLHSLTTSRVFKIPYEHFEKSYMAWLQEHGKVEEAKKLDEKRAIGKTTNFLTGYGGGAFGLQNSLAEEGVYLDIDECERIVDAMFDTYPLLRTYIGMYKRFILKHGCAVSVLGRVRPLEDAYSEDMGLLNKALRGGFNHLIQSTASDLMLSCGSILDDLFYDKGLESMLVSTVHDSLLIDAKRSELPVLHELCSGVINNMPDVLPYFFGPEVDLSWLRVVPIEGEAEVGVTYHMPLKVVPDQATGQVDWDRLLNTAAAVEAKP